MPTQIQLGDIAVDVVLKDIKNIHLSVYPPVGKVRIAAPLRMDMDTIRVFAITKLGWIKSQQKKLLEQQRETPREYLDRESHYVWGKRYLLQLVENDATPEVALKHNKIRLQIRPASSEEKKTGDSGCMVSGEAQGSRAGFDCQMGAAYRCEGGAVFCAKDENEVGQL